MIANTQNLSRDQVEQLVRQALRSQWGAIGQQFKPQAHNGGPNPLVVNVSARHIHVTQEALETLFGPGSKLTKLKDLRALLISSPQVTNGSFKILAQLPRLEQVLLLGTAITCPGLKGFVASHPHIHVLGLPCP